MPFETFGFATNYSVELNPEQPGTGWGDEDRVIVRAGLNDAVIAEVTPIGRDSWLAVDASLGSGLMQSCATPNPDIVCFFAGSYEFGAQLVDVNRPSSSVEVENQVVTVAGYVDLQLLLLVSYTEIVAIGPLGVMWRSERLAWDELIVLEINSDAIVCEGFVADFHRPSRFTIDPKTGAHLDGPDFRRADRPVSLLELVRAGVASIFRRKSV